MDAQPDTQQSPRRREGNAELLCAVLDRYESHLRRQASRHSELLSDVDDVLQSAYLLFLERYRGTGEPLAWLYTTVKREAWSNGRRASRQGELRPASMGQGEDRDLGGMMPADAPTPEQRVMRDEQVAERRRALAELKPDERRALWLLGLGLSYAEICEATGWTYTKVNRCLSEGRAALRSSAIRG